MARELLHYEGVGFIRKVFISIPRTNADIKRRLLPRWPLCMVIWPVIPKFWCCFLGDLCHVCTKLNNGVISGLIRVQHQVKAFDQFLKHRKPQLYQHMVSVFHFVYTWNKSLIIQFSSWQNDTLAKKHSVMKFNMLLIMSGHWKVGGKCVDSVCTGIGVVSEENTCKKQQTKHCVMSRRRCIHVCACICVWDHIWPSD